MYKHIYLMNDKFYIIKNNERYVYFNDIYSALAHRDALVECGWNWDLYIEREVDEKKYVDVDLPVFNHDAEYIQKEKYGSKTKPYAIIKRINGKRKRFGKYRTFSDAVEAREWLIANDWCDLRELKRRKREKLFK